MLGDTMVGGIVVEVVWRDDDDRVFVACRDTRYKDTCAIRVERNADSEQIDVGDRMWWQGGFAFWTPADGSRVDVRIPRRGYSGATLDSRARTKDAI